MIEDNFVEVKVDPNAGAIILYENIHSILVLGQKLHMGQFCYEVENCECKSWGLNGIGYINMKYAMLEGTVRSPWQSGMAEIEEPRVGKAWI